MTPAGGVKIPAGENIGRDECGGKPPLGSTVIINNMKKL